MSEVPCKKRDDYLEWPEYFMAVAFLSAQRSKDPNSQVSEFSKRVDTHRYRDNLEMNKLQQEADAWQLKGRVNLPFVLHP